MMLNEVVVGKSYAVRMPDEADVVMRALSVETCKNRVYLRDPVTGRIRAMHADRLRDVPVAAN